MHVETLWDVYDVGTGAAAAAAAAARGLKCCF